MKASKFNIFFVHEGHNILFNSFSNQFILLEDILHQLYDAAVLNDSFDELNEIHPEFHNHLIENGFVVPKITDEVEKVREVSLAIDRDETSFQLHINPTMNCNFKCWYCYETHIKDSKMDENTILQTEAFIKKVLDENKLLQKFHLSWFGGEPLLYFNKVITKILSFAHAASKDRRIQFSSSITTNGLLINDDVINFSKEHDLDFYQITLDGYREKHDTIRFISEGRGSYDKIISNIFDLARNGITVNVRINIDPDTLKNIKEILNDFSLLEQAHRQYIHFDFHKVWQIQQDIDFEIAENRKYFRNNGFQVGSGVHETVINSCYGDKKNHATINYNGEVFKCTARDFTTENSEGKLGDYGTITWNEKLEKRLNSKFKNKPCLECRILPLCGGGCSQQAIEHEGVDYCVYNFDESKKLEMVRTKFSEILENIA